MADPLTLSLTQDGSNTVYASRFGVTYHSHFGAITETRHVFIEAGLKPLLSLHAPLLILEYGFGTGLNALLTALETEQAGRSVYYTSLEAYPLTADVYTRLAYADHFPDYAAVADYLMRMHTCSWDDWHEVHTHFHFRKIKTKFTDYRPKNSTTHVIYYDAFAPSTQPELWGTEMVHQLYHALADGGRLVTYCAQGAFKRHLKSAGFTVQALPGPPGKREMTLAER